VQGCGIEVDQALTMAIKEPATDSAGWYGMERRTPKHDSQPRTGHGAIIVATVPYRLVFDIPDERPSRWLCVSPIESDGSGLPPMKT
jgi:hypothetical protein